MTNKEVIETLRYIKFYKADKDSAEPHALDLAIKALEGWDRMKLVCANEGVIVYKIKEEEDA